MVSNYINYKSKQERFNVSVNKVIVIGNLGQDPELKHTTTGSAVANFSVATSESWMDKQGQKQEKTEWHRIVVWGKTAESCSKHLNKGSQVYVEGSLQTRQWDDEEGKKRYMTEIRANTVQFLSSKRAEKEQLTAPVASSNTDFTADDIPF